MDDLKISTFVLGSLETNVYIVSSKSAKKAFIIDLPAEFKSVLNYINKENLEISFILITHAHFDHIGGLNLLDLPFYLHRKDLPLLYDPNLNGSSFFDEEISIKKEPIFYDSSLHFLDYTIEVIHTPGHTPGSVSLKLNNWLFTGDTLFYDTIGRTDIPLASYDELLNSINKKILTLPKSTIIYPGHGKDTTLERELKYNPFLKA